MAPRRIAWAVVVAAGIACLPQTLIRLHDSRLGHRAAGKWLAGQGDPSGAVLDTQGWSGLYSGRETYPYEEAPAALGDPHLAYLVVEGREVGYQSGRSRTLRWLIESAAEPVAEFPDPATRKPNQEPVIVYRWHAERFPSRAQAAAVGSAGAGSRQVGASAASVPPGKLVLRESSPSSRVPPASGRDRAPLGSRDQSDLTRTIQCMPTVPARSWLTTVHLRAASR